VDRIPAADRVAGKARFVDRNTLEVDGHTRISARAIVIATGSRPAVPSMLLGAGDRLVVNDDVFSWETLPRSVAVFGPGVIAWSSGSPWRGWACACRARRGGRVGRSPTPWCAKRSSRRSPPALRRSGRARRARDPDHRGVEVGYTRLDGSVRVESFDYVLAATGRRPNVDGLGLEPSARTRRGRRAALRPATLRVGETNLFIAGDASNFIPLLHEAADEGRIAGENAASLPGVEAGKRRMPPAVVFTDPQIAIVGGGYDKLVPGTFETGEVSFDDQGRSRVMRKNRGHLRLRGPRHGRFLGAEMAGPAAEHIGHLLAWAACDQNDGRFDARDALLPPGGGGRAPDGAPGPRCEASIAPGHRRVDGDPGPTPGGAVMRWK